MPVIDEVLGSEQPLQRTGLGKHVIFSEKVLELGAREVGVQFPSTHMQLGVAVGACNPSIGEMETGGPLRIQVSQCNWIGELQVQ